MVEKVTAGATGALGRISMSGYDYNDLAGMMDKIRTGATGGLANITMSGYSADNVSHLTTKIKSGGSGVLGDIRMTGYDHTNPGSTYTNATAGISQMGGAIQGKALSLSTVVTTLAGGSEGTADGTGTSAEFNEPQGITTDGTNLYVTDHKNHTIRKIVISTGVTTTFAGAGGGVFYYPTGITTDGTNLYVADRNNHRIRKIVISSGAVTTLAGSSAGTSDGTGTSAQFNKPQGITTDGTNLYTVSWVNNTVRKIVISTGEVSTLAGTAGTSGNTDATGTSARFSWPFGITTDGTNLYIAEVNTRSIRKVVISSGVVTTFAGSPSGSSGSTDATGTSARFSNPEAITSDGTNLYVADTQNHRIRKIVISSGVVTTLAGSGSGNTDATGTSARFAQPWGITTDGTSLYVTDRLNDKVRKIE
jgi:DNA-binding beta-propeller fold protein YncE